MDTLIEAEPRRLCHVDEIPDGSAKGFPPAPGGFNGIVVYRKGDDIHVYVNSCPHIGTPLDWTPDRFMSRDGKYIICATHGAAFAPDTGLCLLGPCEGDYLDKIKFDIKDGVIHVPANAGL